MRWNEENKPSVEWMLHEWELYVTDLKPINVLKRKQKSTERIAHGPHPHISAASPPTVCKSFPWVITLLYDSLCQRHAWANSLWGWTSALGGFSSLWLACKCWIWHLHLSVISSGYQLQISSFCCHLSRVILLSVYVYLEHLASLHCAIVSQNAWFDGSKIFPLWFALHSAMAFLRASHFLASFYALHLHTV